MPDDSLPEPQPSGALVPPPRTPPVALATIEPQPPLRPRADAVDPQRGLLRLVDAALDALDDVGDRVASLVGLR